MTTISAPPSAPASSWQLHYLPQVPSTNAWAREHLIDLADRTVVYTFAQSAGRGRMDRSWADLGPGNLFASLVLKPSQRMEERYLCLTQLLSLSIARSCDACGAPASIKWPNDVLIRGRKVSGILAEAVVEQELLRGVVLGFGVNLTADPAALTRLGRPATALSLETGRAPGQENFLREVFEHFFSVYTEFIVEGFTLIRTEYLSRAVFIGQTITVVSCGRELHGTAEDIDEQGRLLLRTDGGRLELLSMGDIT